MDKLNFKRQNMEINQRQYDQLISEQSEDWIVSSSSDDEELNSSKARLKERPKKKYLKIKGEGLIDRSDSSEDNRD